MKFKTWLIINEALDNSQIMTIQGYVRKNYPNLSQQELESILNKFQEDPNPTPTNAVFQTLVNKFGRLERDRLDISFAENMYKELGIQPNNQNELRAIQYFKNENIESLKEIARELNALIKDRKISLEFEKGVPVLVSGNQKTKTIDFRTFTTKLHEIMTATADYDPDKADPQDLAETYKEELVARSSDGKIMVFRAKDPIQCRAMGKGQKWCISSSSSVQWYFNYRHDYGQTQYFIFDFNKSKGDPARYVNPGVAPDGRYSEWVDATNDPQEVNEDLSFHINGYETLEDYLDYLESNGISRNIFIATPIEQHEIDLKKYLMHYKAGSMTLQEIREKAKEHPGFMDRFLSLVQLNYEDFRSLNSKEMKEYFSAKSERKANIHMHYAAKEGKKDLVEFLLQKGANLLNIGMRDAALNGHKDIVELLIEKGANELNNAMYYAASYGHKDVVELLAEKGANDFNSAMVAAALNGDKYIVELMIEKGANNFNNAMIWAAKYDHKDIIKLMIEKGANNFNNAMRSAASYGHIDIIKLLIEKGAKDFNDAMYYAAENGHKDIVELMIEKGANNFDETMREAARNGHKEIVELMIEKGADEFDRAMYYAAENGHKDIVELLIEKGAKDFNDAMIYAAKNGHKDIVALMIEKGANNFDNYAINMADNNGHKEIVELLKNAKSKFNR